MKTKLYTYALCLALLLAGAGGPQMLGIVWGT
jgi:hypothetical protein